MAAMWIMLVTHWSPLLDVILLNLLLSPTKARVTPAEILSHQGGCDGTGFPQIKLGKEKTVE